MRTVFERIEAPIFIFNSGNQELRGSLAAEMKLLQKDGAVAWSTTVVDVVEAINRKEERPTRGYIYNSIIATYLLYIVLYLL